jgi:hypothetical protein
MSDDALLGEVLYRHMRLSIAMDEAEALLELLADQLICHDEPTAVAYGLLEAALRRLTVEPRGDVRGPHLVDLGRSVPSYTSSGDKVPQTSCSATRPCTFVEDGSRHCPPR